MRAAAIAALLVLPLTGCPWPTYFEDPPRPRNTEPRIIRDPSQTNPMYEVSLQIDEDPAKQPVLDIDLCVWEPDQEDSVRVRFFLDYGIGGQTPPPMTSRTIFPSDATEEDPEIRCAQFQLDGACSAAAPDNAVQMVDVVVAQQFDPDETLVPEWRRSVSGYTDEFRIKVFCLARETP